jgi:hypothetical protein
MVIQVALLAHLPGEPISEFLTTIMIFITSQNLRWRLEQGLVNFFAESVRYMLWRLIFTSKRALVTGQVGGVGIASAIFQYYLDKELKARIKIPDADKVNDLFRYLIEISD